MSTCVMFITEEIAEATYGRHTFHAANLSLSLFVTKFPYTLTGIFSCLLELTADEEISNAKLLLEVPGDQLVTMVIDPIDLCKKGTQRRCMFSLPKMQYLLTRPGPIKMTFICGEFVHTNEWTVSEGAAAYRRCNVSLPPTAVIDGREDWNPLNELKHEVHRELFIADPYLNQDFLRRFLDESTQGWSVKVLTNRRGFNQGPSGIDLKESHPNVEVRFDDLFHDRLICRDGEEIYTFGGSLKDLNNNRVSFFQRIYDKNFTSRCVELLSESWQSAQPR